MNPSLPRILVAGVGPLPPERPDRLYAPGLRVWGMARELARAGHPVRLVCARFGDIAQASRFDLEPAREPQLPAGAELTVEGGDWAELLAREARNFDAAAAVSTTDVMNHALSTGGLELPFWFDFFGDPMAERQMLALRHASDDGLAEQWAYVAPALARGDRFSGCCADQCAAILGQLGAMGRLNQFTVRDGLVHCVKPWVELIPIDIDTAPIVRPARVPEDAYLVLQTGGFNTWLDVETLFATLERAMAGEPRLHFATTGGAIPGHHLSGFEWFEQAVAGSPHRDRYHLLGWLPLTQVPRVIGEADAALNLDLDCPEGRLGTRNRLIDWLMGGLTVISTPGCELARDMGAQGRLTLVPHGDPEAAAAALIEAARQQADAAGTLDGRSRLATARQAGADYLREAHAADICLKPLLDWAAAPKPASDLHRWRSGTARPPALLGQMLAGAALTTEARQQAEKAARLERRLAQLEGSRLVRWACRLGNCLHSGRDPEREPPPGAS